MQRSTRYGLHARLHAIHIHYIQGPVSCLGAWHASRK